MSAQEADHGPWLRKADHDLLAIKNNMEAAETPWDVVCFHAQQAAEKSLKALIAFQGGRIERTHDLVKLLSDCLLWRPELRALAEDCRRLTHYAVTSRYPFMVYEPDKADGIALAEAAVRVREAIGRLLPS